MPLVDALGRPLGGLRLSVTDRCNLRCRYCMPENDYAWLPRSEVLTFDELSRLVGLFSALGATRVRLTGGEPLLRRDLPTLVGMLAAQPGVEDLALTTNGLLLARHAGALRAAGLMRLTVSLDTLRPERFAALTRVDGLPKVMRGIETARACGFGPLKLDAVIVRGVNEDELAELVGFARQLEAEVRFIEYMAVGGATRWSPAHTVPAAEMLATLAAHFGPPRPVAGRGPAPAQRYRLPDGTIFGVIASNTEPFCGSCNRGRLTADGMWYPCLHAADGLDLKGPLRAGADDATLHEVIAERWRRRDDRGAEQRAADTAASQRATAPDGLRDDPHLEMHTRGG